MHTNRSSFLARTEWVSKRLIVVWLALEAFLVLVAVGIVLAAS